MFNTSANFLAEPRMKRECLKEWEREMTNWWRSKKEMQQEMHSENHNTSLIHNQFPATDVPCHWIMFPFKQNVAKPGIALPNAERKGSYIINQCVKNVERFNYQSHCQKLIPAIINNVFAFVLLLYFNFLQKLSNCWYLFCVALLCQCFCISSGGLFACQMYGLFICCSPIPLQQSSPIATSFLIDFRL